jgi:glycogen debranching enzyme
MSEIKKAYIKEFIKHNGGYHKILIEYTKSGRTTFKKLANEDRDRSFCFVLKGIILSCRGLPPSHKGLYLKGISIAKNSKSEAQRIVDDINKLIKSEHPTK